MSRKYLKQQRQFSPTLKRSIIDSFDHGRMSAKQISREYNVSESTVYRWIYKYSQHNTKGTIIVMDKKKQHNEVQALKQRIAELERAIGTKQMQIDYYEMYVKTMDELAPEELKKKWKSPDYTGSTRHEKSTGGR
jgi:transposase-like protein